MSAVASPIEPVVPQDNPFKGLAYYEAADAGRFAGRQRDVETVVNGILRTRTFVVYGRSGLGKTSLLLAGVFPRLEKEKGCRPIYVRVLEDPLGDLRRSLLEQGGPGMAGAEALDLAALVERAGRGPGGTERLVVIAFDQFEEFFVRFADQADPSGGVRSGEELDREARQRRIEQRQAFIREVGLLAAADLNLRLVFSLREDWLAEMQDLAGVIPEIGREGFRLLPLTSFGARQAIVETLQSSRASFDAGLVSALVDTMADVGFEPVLLQVMGSEVWERARIRSDGGPIELKLEDLQKVGKGRDLFQSFLDQIDRETEGAGLRRKIQTRAVLEALISEKRTKLAVTRDVLLQQYFAITDQELDAVLRSLYRHRLVRRDPRGDVIWFELLHERLVDEILKWLDLDPDFFKFRSARNLVINLSRNPGWREAPGLLLNKGQLDGTVGPFKDLLRFNEEEKLFLVSSAIDAKSDDLEFWADLAGNKTSTELLDRLLDQKENDRVREHAAEAAGRVAERSGHIAERCLDLALHDSSEAVRRAAARSFSDLASPDHFQALGAYLRRPSEKKNAVAALTEVMDKDRLPAKGWFGWRSRLQARRALYKRRLDAGREELRERSLKGALTGLLAGLVWSLTAGALLLRMFLYEVFTDTALPNPWLWPAVVGIYVVLSVLLGTWTGWVVARQVAKNFLQTRLEGRFFQAFTEGFLPRSCWVLSAVFLIGMMVWWKLFERTIPLFLNDVDILGVFVSVLFSFVAGAALMVALARPEVLGAGRLQRWGWGWLWAFGSSLAVPLMVWYRFKELVNNIASASEGNSLLALFQRMGLLFFLVFLVISTAIGGLVTYSGVLSIAFSSPGGTSRKDFRPVASAGNWRWGKALGLGLAVVAMVLLIFCQRWDSLPFLATPVKLGYEDLSLEAHLGRGAVDAFHVDLIAQPMEGKGGERPRIAYLQFPEPLKAFSRHGPLKSGSILALMPGQSLRLAFQVVERSQSQALTPRIRFQPDRPLDTKGPLRQEEQRLAVVPLSKTKKEGAWSGLLSPPHRSGNSAPLLALALGGVAGGGWCENMGFMLQIKGAGPSGLIPHRLRCAAEPEQVVFTQERPWEPGDSAAEFVVRGWKPAILKHGRGVDWATFSPDGTRVVTTTAVSRGLESELIEGPSSDTVLLWNLNDLRNSPELKHKGFVVSAAFSPDGLDVATLSFNSTLEGFTLHSWRVDGYPRETSVGSRVPSRSPAEGTKSIKFSPDGKRLGISIGDSTLRLLKRGSSGPFSVLENEGDVSSFVFSPAGDRVATVDTHGIVRIWRVEGSEKPAVLRTLFVSRVSFSPDGAWVATANLDGTAAIWKFDHPGSPIILPFLPVAFRKTSQMAQMSVPNLMSIMFLKAAEELLDKEEFRRRAQQLDNTDDANSVAFSPDGTRVVVAYNDGTAGVWNWTTSRLAEPVILHHEDSVVEAEFSPNGTRVLTACSDGTARIWNADGSGEPIILDHPKKVVSAVFSRDGSRVLTRSEDGAARVWNLAQPSIPKEAGDLYLFLRIRNAEPGAGGAGTARGSKP